MHMGYLARLFRYIKENSSDGRFTDPALTGFMNDTPITFYRDQPFEEMDAAPGSRTADSSTCSTPGMRNPRKARSAL